jgi:hypothetical protein
MSIGIFDPRKWWKTGRRVVNIAGDVVDTAGDIARGLRSTEPPVRKFRTQGQALEVARSLPRERVSEIINLLPSRRTSLGGATGFVGKYENEALEAANEVAAIKRLADTPSGRYSLARITGEVVPEASLPAGARRGLGERRFIERARVGKTVRPLSDVPFTTRASRFIQRRSLPAQLALGAGLGGAGYVAYNRLFGGEAGQPSNLTDEQLAAILSGLSTVTPEGTIEDIYGQASANAAFTGVDPALEKYLRDINNEYKAAVSQAYGRAEAELAALSAATGQTPGVGGQEQLARDVAASAMPGGTAVSTVTPMSAEMSEMAPGIRQDAARAAGGVSRQDRMLAEDLAYLSGVMNLMGVQAGSEAEQYLNRLLTAEAVRGSREARESQQLLNQQRLEALGGLALERAKTGSAYTATQTEQLVYQYAREWADLSAQQKAIETTRRGLTGTNDQELQRQYIESKLRESGLYK